ncbi:MAG: SpoIID/LytB domain-containing protein, partial [Candidatus Ventricola sp.]
MKRAGLFLLILWLALTLPGCAARGGKDSPALPKPQNTTAAQAKASPGRAAADLVPERLERNGEGVPVLRVYDVKNEKLEKLSVEDYLPAVLAGEMAGDWPMEALKAQAILARTFVLQFVTEKKSRYEGADISTDIE